MSEVLVTKLASALKQDVARKHNLPVSSLTMTPEQDAAFLQRLDKGSLVEVDMELIRDLRQVAKFTYKVKVEPTRNQREETQKAFLDRNRGCLAWRGDGFLSAAASRSESPDQCGREPSPIIRTLLLAKRIVGYLTRNYSGPAIPRHGPGTTYFKYDTRYTKYRYLERDVPEAIMLRMAELFRPSGASEFVDGLPTLNVCRLSCVPKDARGPRLVAPHLASAMWAQQAVLDAIEDMLETEEGLLSTHILYEDERVVSLQLRDQSINRRVAQLGSKYPDLYATLDLKDASDRISLRLVEFLFRGTTLLEDLKAVRATHVEVDGTTHELFMHAPMGSACCFPVMGISLWALAVATMWTLDTEQHVDPDESFPSKRSLYWATKPFVFGDDVIVPTRYVDAIRTIFSVCGLQINERKTFAGQAFRESCGGEYYKGVDIAPRLLRTADTSDISSVVGLVTLYNAVAPRYYDLSEEILKELLKAPAGIVAFSSDPNEQSCIFVEPTNVAIRLNRQIGNVVRYHPGYQCYQVLVRRLIREEETGIDPRVDSRARLYEALAGRAQKARPGRSCLGWESQGSHEAQRWLCV